MWSGAKIGFMDTARGVQQIAGINEEELAQEQRELNTLMEDEEVGWAAKTGYFGGLIAEEVHDAGLTEFVTYNDDNQPDALAYGNMVSLCIKAIQEQQATITALEARIAALEAN